ncbi:MAG: carotenoid biosynthesis protein [Calditrichaceae bacterium]
MKEISILLSVAFTKKDTLKLLVIYVLMIAGGLWHLLGWFQPVMQNSASLAMGLITLWIIYEYYRLYKTRGKSKGDKKRDFFRLLSWTGSVFVLSLAIEEIGVSTGMLFGEYNYGEILRPFFINVPVAIGFSWVNLLLGSMAVVSVINPGYSRVNPVLISIMIAVLMVAFDFLMEPAAVKLGYWEWEDNVIPVRNYLSWFVFGFLFAWSASGTGILKRGIPGITMHAWFAQLAYFFIVTLK